MRSRTRVKQGTRTRVDPVEVEKFLLEAEFPASKKELMSYAKEQEADEDVREALAHLPEQEEYEIPSDVGEALEKRQA